MLCLIGGSIVPNSAPLFSRGLRLSLGALDLRLPVHSPAELIAFDFRLLTWNVTYLCKEVWQDHHVIFYGFWLEAWTVDNDFVFSMDSWRKSAVSDRFIINCDYD